MEHSDGQTEVQINRLQLIWLTMYGQGAVDVLRPWVLCAR